MYCRNCGKEMNNNADVCLNCGVAVRNTQQPVENKTNVLAILGFIFAFIFPVAGFICSIIAYGKVKETGENGKGLALAGIIVSAAISVFIILCLIIYIGLIIGLSMLAYSAMF